MTDQINWRYFLIGLGVLALAGLVLKIVL